MYEVQIDNVSSFKYLGIMLNEHLTWKAHANMITSSWNNEQIKVFIRKLL